MFDSTSGFSYNTIRMSHTEGKYFHSSYQTHRDIAPGDKTTAQPKVYGRYSFSPEEAQHASKERLKYGKESMADEAVRPLDQVFGKVNSVLKKLEDRFYTPPQQVPLIPSIFLRDGEFEAQIDSRINSNVVFQQFDTQSIKELGSPANRAMLRSYLDSEGMRNMLVPASYKALLAVTPEKYFEKISASYSTVLLGFTSLYGCLTSLPDVIPFAGDAQHLSDYFLSSVQKKTAEIQALGGILRKAHAPEDLQQTLKAQDNKAFYIHGGVMYQFGQESSPYVVVAGETVQRAVVCRFMKSLFPEFLKEMSLDATSKEWFIHPDKWPKSPSDVSENIRAEVRNTPNDFQNTFFNGWRSYDWIQSDIIENIRAGNEAFRSIVVPDMANPKKRPRNLTDLSDSALFDLFIRGNLAFYEFPKLNQNPGKDVIEFKQDFDVYFNAELAVLENRKKELYGQDKE